MSRTIGIDLGTTYSGAAVFIDNGLTIIPDDRGETLIPSMVAFNDDQILVGEEVKHQLITNPKNSVYQIKRIIGRNYDDKSVQQDKKIWDFDVVKDEEGHPQISVEFNKLKKRFTSEEISSFIIKKLKLFSENYLGQIIYDAVISVPAYFDNNQKAATRNAGVMAGLNVKHIINEPTAAALAYGLGRDKSDLNPKTILVYDLGGGTFDICILRICGREFTVKGINGDSHLGGEDFTYRMVNHLLLEFESKYKISVIEVTNKMKHRLREACEIAKRKLGEEHCEETLIELDGFHIKKNLEEIDYYTSFTRNTFVAINADLFNMTIELVETCLEDAKLTEYDIDEVILVGGSTRIPKIRSMLADKFTKEKINCSINPDEAVALGAAIEAAIICKDTSESLRDMILKDVNPLSMGVQVDLDQKMCTCIPRNTQLPVTSSMVLRTLHDNQETCKFSIFEGEHIYCSDNILLGEFRICNIPKGPAGSVKFDVTFDLDINGILHVTAVEPSTKKSENITIQNDFRRLSEAKIKNIMENIKDLEQFGQSNQSKHKKKRYLERYLFDMNDYLTLESTQNKISSRIEKKCRGKHEAITKQLMEHEIVTEANIDSWLTDLKEVCEPELNNLFKEEKKRNLGETKFVKQTYI